MIQDFSWINTTIVGFHYEYHIIVLHVLSGIVMETQGLKNKEYVINSSDRGSV
jgi:hypothetical protein